MNLRLLVYSVVVLVMCASTTSYAQQQFKAGAIAGLTATDIVGVHPGGKSLRKVGLTAGGLVATNLSEKNALQFELLYIQKGSFQPYDSAYSPLYLKISLDYIELPLLFKHNFKINFHGKSITGLSFEIGPSIGRLIRTRINSEGYIFNEGNFRKNELAINLGIGYQLGNKFLVNLRYTNSIIPVVKHPILFDTFFWRTFNKGDNMVFALTLRYMILGVH